MNKDTIYCSLGHAGHTDDQCKTRKWREFKEFQQLMKNKTLTPSSNVKNKDAAQMTQDQPIDNLDPDDVHVSYDDITFTATNTKLPTIFDTGASSHMFGDRDVFTIITRREPSRIGVASKEGVIWSKEKGSVSNWRSISQNCVVF